jgi:hypothetical protein
MARTARARSDTAGGGSSVATSSASKAMMMTQKIMGRSGASAFAGVRGSEGAPYPNAEFPR